MCMSVTNKVPMQFIDSLGVQPESQTKWMMRLLSFSGHELNVKKELRAAL